MLTFVALCQFLPGPASSQVGMAIGIVRAGLLGGVAAWVGFTLPSAVALVAFAYALRTVGFGDAGWLHGLKVVAVAVVAQAVWGMARNLAPDRTRASPRSSPLSWSWPPAPQPRRCSPSSVPVCSGGCSFAPRRQRRQRPRRP